ncbi:MAG: site-specific DNA-methyltransferase [Alphaproteobacteria bacterium]|nr:site-specific DNA-methyltransferase [Alphaproteobacteria bacterium]
MKKAKRNKTIDITVEEGKQYLAKCLTSKDDLADVKKIINKTICGDTFDVLSELPSGFVDLLIVDPPYNLSKNYEGNKFSATNDEVYRKYTIKWVEKLKPLLKENGSIYVCCDWKTSLIIGDVLKNYFKIQNRITWQREKGRGASANWKNSMEDIWFCTKSDKYTFNLEAVKIRKKVMAPYKVNGKPKDWEETANGNYRNTCPSNFWDDISIPYWSMPENTAHPTQKPEKLIAKLVLASSNEGDVIFDPFLGSGTTSVVCKKLNRKYCGIEQNERYCVWCEKRLETAETDKSIQGYANGVFWARNSADMPKKSTEK